MCPVLENSTADMDHAARGLLKTGLADVMAGLFFLHHGAYVLGQLCIAGACIKASRQVVIKEREQASANFAIRGQADAGAVSAERMRNGSNNADLSQAIIEGVAPRCFT